MRIYPNERRRLLFWACLGLSLAFKLSCATTQQEAKPAPERLPQFDGDLGVYHEVKAGDTLWAVSREYGVPVDELIEVNALDDVQGLMIGQLLYVPVPLPKKEAREAKRVIHPAESPAAEPSTVSSSPKEERAMIGGSYMEWPLLDAGIIFRSFRAGTDVPYEGISLGAPAGTPVLAVLDGEVKYVGEEPNAFGKLVLLKHVQGFITVYAHMQTIDVSQGAKVKQGTVLGAVGETGRTESPQLFFQVRQERQPKNPLLYLSVSDDE